jgi:hypothetical protein
VSCTQSLLSAASCTSKACSWLMDCIQLLQDILQEPTVLLHACWQHPLPHSVSQLLGLLSNAVQPLGNWWSCAKQHNTLRYAYLDEQVFVFTHSPAAWSTTHSQIPVSFHLWPPCF